MAIPTELVSSTLYTDNIYKEIGGSALDVSTLKALYKFNTGALTTDSSGEGHTLTDISDPAEVAGVFGTAAEFDGDDAYSATDHADFKPTGAFSISVWVKSNGGTSDMIFQSFAYPDSKYSGIYLKTGAAGLVSLVSGKNTGAVDGTDYKSVTSTTAVNDNVWHHVAGTWDESSLRLYIDGVQEGGGVNWVNAPVYGATNYVRVGCQNNAGTNASFWVGQLDDLAFWNGKCLTYSEIKGIFGRLSAYYKFSTGALTTDTSHWNTLAAGAASLEVDGVFGKATDLTSLVTPTAWYKFSAGALTTDSSGSGYTLTAVSDPAEDASGKFGGAVALDGDDAYSRADHANWKPTGNFSISVWVKGVSAANGYIFQSYAFAGSVSAGIRLTTGSTGLVGFFIGNNAGTNPEVGSTTAVTDGNWHHVVATWDGTHMKLYIDKVQEGGDVDGVAPVYQGTNYVRLGCRSRTGTDAIFLTGSLDDFAFYNGTVLTQTQINRLYNAEVDKSGDSYTITNTTNLRPTGTFTIGCWVKVLDTAITRVIFQSYSANTNLAGIVLSIASDGRANLLVAKNTGTTSGTDYHAKSGDVVNDGNWHFVVGTYDESNISVYVDDNAVYQQAWGYGAGYASTSYVRIGCRNRSGSNDNYWNGYIDDLFLINGIALTSDEILSLYTKSKKVAGVGMRVIKKISSNTKATVKKVGGQ